MHEFSRWQRRIDDVVQCSASQIRGCCRDGTAQLASDRAVQICATSIAGLLRPGTGCVGGASVTRPSLDGGEAKESLAEGGRRDADVLAEQASERVAVFVTDAGGNRVEPQPRVFQQLLGPFQAQGLEVAEGCIAGGILESPLEVAHTETKAFSQLVDTDWGGEIRLFVKDQRVIAVVVMRGLFRGRKGVVAPGEFARELGLEEQSPPLPQWLREWSASCDRLSSQLREMEGLEGRVP